MGTRISTTARDAACNGIVDLIEVGAGTSKLQFWSGTRPGTFGAAPGGTLLAEISLAATAFGASATGVATAAGLPLATTGLAAGVIAFATVLDQNGDEVMDTDSVGTSATEIVVNTTSVSVGVDVTVTAWTVTMPAGT